MSYSYYLKLCRHYKIRGDCPVMPSIDQDRYYDGEVTYTISIWIVDSVGVFYSCRDLRNGYHDVAEIVAYGKSKKNTEEAIEEYGRLDIGPIPEGIVLGNLSTEPRVQKDPWEFLRCPSIPSFKPNYFVCHDHFNPLHHNYTRSVILFSTALKIRPLNC